MNNGKRIIKRGAKMKNYINIMEKDRELCLSNNLEEIEKKFEP